MRVKNWRVVNVGVVLLVLALAFFFYMMTLQSQSNDPAEMMRTVGEVSGVACGIAIAMIIFGLIGKKT